MNRDTQLATRDPFALPDRATAETKFRAITEFQKLVHSQMVRDLDYGVIPGTMKPTLLKPGAEKIAKLLGLADQYEVMDKVEDWEKGFFAYTIRCILQDMASQVVVSSGLGSCNTKEARYRWREQKRKCPRCGAEAIFKSKQTKGGWYCFGKLGGCGANFVDGDQAIETQATGRVENDDTFSLVNTILKMARKRALVDAALSAGRLSAIFTQDMEDEGIGPQPPTTDDERPVKPAVPPQKSPSGAPPQSQVPPQAPEAAPSAKAASVVADPNIANIKNAGELCYYVQQKHRTRTARTNVEFVMGKDVNQLATSEECQKAAAFVDLVVEALDKPLSHATPEELTVAITKAKEQKP